MAVQLHRPGATHARSMIRAGRVDQDSSWSFSADDGNAILGDPPDWTRYGSFHLGVNTEEKRDTKAHWMYPFGKLVNGRGVVFRSALRAIRTRSSQQGHTAIFEEAGKLMALLDEEKKDKGATVYSGIFAAVIQKGLRDAEGEPEDA